jgi:enoyl-CoA hydratase/carnithine racemase
MSDERVLARGGRVTRITLNRPEARNALSSSMLDDLVHALAAAADDPDCRVVVVAGAGKDFCAGADVGELAAGHGREGATAAYGVALDAVLAAVEAHPRPILASVQGAALGAGCQLVSACDLVVSGEDARFGIPSARLGVVMGYESVERLAAAVGIKRAGQMLLAGRTVSGLEAVEWGLATVAVESDALSTATEEFAQQVAALAPLSVAASKRGLRAVARGSGPGSPGRPEFERLAAEAMASRDLGEGLAALRRRRPPTFEGR